MREIHEIEHAYWKLQSSKIARDKVFWFSEGNEKKVSLPKCRATNTVSLNSDQNDFNAKFNISHLTKEKFIAYGFVVAIQ